MSLKNPLLLFEILSQRRRWSAFLPPFLAINGRQLTIGVVRGHLVVPVVQHAVAFLLLAFVVHVFDVHTRVVREVAEANFVELLCEKVFTPSNVRRA